MHQRENDNSVVHLGRPLKAPPPPLRIASKSPREEALRAFRVKQNNSGPLVLRKPDMRGVRRAIDAIALGEDVRLAAAPRASFLSRVMAALLLPLLFGSPIIAAASEDVPIAAQVEAIVSEVITPEIPAAPSADASAPVDPPVTQETPVVVPETPVENAESPVASSTPSEPTPSGNQSEDQPNSSPSVPPAQTPEENKSEDQVLPVASSTSVEIPRDSGSGGAPSLGVPAATTPTESGHETSTSSNETVVPEVNQPLPIDGDETSTSTPEANILDAAPPDKQEELENIRAELRAELRSSIEQEVKTEMKDSIRDQVRMELQKSVEQKMMAKCTKLPDGSGTYCIDNMDVFGTKTEANDEVSVVSAPNSIDGNKEIFVTRGASSFKLTGNADDDINPSLDPVGGIVAWQSMQNGRFQIAWSDLRAAKPKVNVLTDGENNFYPKVFGGRIAWQAWVDGNWEIVWAEPERISVPDDQLSPENRTLGIGGDWAVHRITHNSSPDMFPTFSRLGVSWQGVDGGVWQVFSYDFESGKTVRVSRAGVSSEAPQAAMVWTERLGGEERLVGRSLSDERSIDFTDAARRLGDNTPAAPKAPVTDTQMIAVNTGNRIEGVASTTTASGE